MIDLVHDYSDQSSCGDSEATSATTSDPTDLLDDEVPSPANDSPDALTEDEMQEFRTLIDNHPQFDHAADLYRQLVDAASSILHDYQLVSVCRVLKKFIHDFDHTQGLGAAGIVLPTGVGKSYIIYFLALFFRVMGLKSLVLQPNLTLLRSMVKKLLNVIKQMQGGHDLKERIIPSGRNNRGMWELVVKKNTSSNARRNRTHQYQLTTQEVNTTEGAQLLDQAWFLVVNYQKKAVLEKGVFDYFQPDVIMIDEAHHAAAESYRQVLLACKSARFRLYLTACFDRHDDKCVKDPLVDSHPQIVYQKSLSWAVARRLVKVPKVLNVVFNNITVNRQKIHNDNVSEVERERYRRTDLETDDHPLVRRLFSGTGPGCHLLYSLLALRTIRCLEENRAKSKQISGGLSTDEIPMHVALVIASKKKQADRIARIFNQFKTSNEYGESVPVIAKALHTGMSASERERIIEEFDNQEIDILVQVGMLREGYSNDYISVVAFFSSYRSAPEVLQLVGRGLRLIKRGHDDPRPEENELLIITANFHRMKEIWPKLNIVSQTSLNSVAFNAQPNDNGESSNQNSNSQNSQGGKAGAGQSKTEKKNKRKANKPSFSYQLAGLTGDNGAEVFDLNNQPADVPESITTAYTEEDIVNYYQDFFVPMNERRRRRRSDSDHSDSDDDYDENSNGTSSDDSDADDDVNQTILAIARKIKNSRKKKKKRPKRNDSDRREGRGRPDKGKERA